MTGQKPVENRSWRTNYRGVLAIHAALGKRSDVSGREQITQLGLRVPDELERGVLLGTIEIVDCIATAEAVERFGPEWVDGPWCWVLEKPRLLRVPLACRGKLSLFEVPDLVEESFQ